ncbi:lysosome-associated membrane glycoprotein 5-like [Limulus polyphemus]|uniref:Lysosome-associated membrane glycoprotein 5-like n=1 Tax=Limulus polyphemus TaxID=6850 RepID=A0ABM1SJ09_LIMPO|nr:lysosome-associated membrane glycoprotein 5-like [Limulus polyphemus]
MDAEARDFNSDHPVTVVSQNLSDDTSNPPKDKPYVFNVWNKDHKVCLLASFQASFLISYASRGGKQCFSLIILWFTTQFSPESEGAVSTWAVTSVELLFNTSGSPFEEATNGGKKTVRNAENIKLFETPIGNSYSCSSPELIPLFDSKKDKVVSVRLRNVKLQPFQVDNERFSAAHHCSFLTFDGMIEPLPQDETIPIAVGGTLAVIVLILVTGFAAYRWITSKRVDYNTME